MATGSIKAKFLACFLCFLPSAQQIHGIDVSNTWTQYADFSSSDARTGINNAASDNANWVGINFLWIQTDRHSCDAAAAAMTPSDTQLEAMIAYAHSRGMKVMLKPMINGNDGSSMAAFFPTDVSCWFSTYQTFITHYASIAQAYNVEMMSIGTEYNNLDGAANTSNWNTIIGAVKAVYSGKITYAAMWSDALNVGFWPSMDYIGVNAYFPFAPNGIDPSISYLVSQWSVVCYNAAASCNNQSPIDYMKGLSAQYGKQILLTEVGWTSTQQAYTSPAVAISSTADNTEQANDYQAFFNVLGGNISWLAGEFFWNYEPMTQADLNATGSTNYPLWFTPQGKSAESILQSNFR